MRRWLKWAGIGVLVVLFGLIAAYWTPDTDRSAMQAKYGAPPSQFVDLGSGLRVHVRDEGPRDAPVLILLHGSNSDLQTWQPWVDRLGTRYRIVRFDQIGHGLTGPNPTRDYSDAAFVGTLDRLMRKLAIGKFVLAGSSMGGGVAWRYALAHPERLNGLVLIDASGMPKTNDEGTPLAFRLARTPGPRELMLMITPRALIADGLRQSFGNPGLVTETMIDRYWELLRYPGNRQATLDRFTTPRTPSDPASLAALRIPTLILWGQRDQLLPVSGARWFGDRIAGSKVVIYPDVGHLPMEEAPDASAADLVRFMEALPAAITR